ncbi:hypothetical protein BPAE_0023g00580 [Botrytis paeoniae]|uniref:Carrier domain-containing protein n=1 Tax=Botrytis paeoniae TaxID=278948 RepID=A0A4Z1G318_9HELO|nr:hypothetical protein BPAE_0023g00580 [Botrytis paeoniae]
MGLLTEPAYGERLLHQTLDYLSRVSPHRLYASIPHSADLSEGFLDVSFRDMARCSDFVANWIQDNIGRILHSSDSTGIPKPITMTHGTIAVLDNEWNPPGVPGRKNRDFSIWDFQGGGKFYHVFPYFHLAGFLSNIVNPTFTEASGPVLDPPLEPPSATLLKEIMRHQKLRALYIPPAIAEQLLQEPEGIDFFRDLDFLCYTGAPFSLNAGKRLVEVTELCSLYGSTEAFQVPQLAPPKEDWAENFNPVPMELMIQSHPFLAGALVMGNGRATKENLWPYVEEANALAPGHGRILISNIIIADKTLSRAGKGTIVRKLTEKAFKKEIEALHNQTKLSTSNKIPSFKAIFERESVRNFVRSIVDSCFPIAANVSDDEDLFSHGLDSLKITELVAILRSGIAEHASSSDPLYAMIFSIPAVLHRETMQARISTMENLVRKYTHNLPVRSPYSPGDAPQTSSKICIAITGTLGTVLLSTLLPNLRISRIYCLNRNVSARVTQESILANRGIESSLFSKLHFMTVKMDSPNLGLSFSDYKMLVDDIDIIIHNAWKVDFNLSLQSFEIPYLRSVRNVTEVCLNSKKGARLCFVSSVSAVMDVMEGDLIQEEPARDFETAFKLGYGESKAISGSTSAIDPPWPKQEWLYPILLASKTLCLLPQQLTPIDWVSIDLAAAIISKISASYGDASSISEAKYSSESEDEKNIQVYNIVNPAPISWDLLVEILQERFGKDSGRQIKILPLREWVEEIEKYSANLDVKTMGIEATLKAALKMIKRLGNGKAIDDVRYMTDKSKRASGTMRGMKGIDREMIEMWLRQWRL